MKAFGMIETKGLIAAIEGADVMTKTSNVSLLEKIHIGAGLVTITISGDVGAVKSAVDAGVSAINNLGEGFLVSSHVIARPHEELKDIFVIEKNGLAKEQNRDFSEADKLEVEEIVEQEIEEVVEEIQLINIPEDKKEVIDKDLIERWIKEEKINELEEKLNSLKISEVRKILKECKELGLTGKQISKLSKEMIIKKIFEYYEII